MKYAFGIVICLACIGASLWGTLEYRPARDTVAVVADSGIAGHVAQAGSHVVTDNTSVPSIPEPQVAAPVVTDNCSSPAGAGVVHASFTVVG